VEDPDRGRDRLGEVALYGEVSYPLTRRLTATVGLRGFHSWLHTDSNVVQEPQTRLFSGETESNAMSPKFVLSWQLKPTSLLYLEVSEGYRVGGFNTSGRIGQLFTAAASGRQPDRLFQPDTLWSLETGLKATLLQERVQLHLAGYFADWRNIQSDQFLGSGLPYTANVGSGVDVGLEMEATYKIDSRWTLRANMLINGTELTQRDPTYPARKNAALPAVPSQSAALIADYRRPLTADMHLVLHGRFNYVGPSILTFDEGTQPTQGRYATGKLSGGVETSHWRLIAFIDNPTNTRGDTFAFGDPFSLGRVQQVTPLRPRTFGLTLAVGL
jgi:outer membrane receptor protein involved in Fe transport